jgi:hypothetical protein
MRTALRRRLLSLPLTVAISIALCANNASAQPNEPLSPTDDGGTAEMGVEWITDWPGTADDRANWYYSANHFYNELKNGGWVGRFNWGNTNAWERDFKAAIYGGISDSMIDAVDIALIGTHGTGAWDSRYSKNLSAVYFSSDNDDWFLSPGEAYRAYGNDDLEWLAFDSCSVLRDDSMYYWHEAFDGLHLMLGFANTMYVVYPGDGGVWGDQMQTKGWWIFGHGAKTVTQAWFSAVEDQQPSGVRARVLAEELNSYNDYIWGQGYVSPDYGNSYPYWYWDHVAGTPAPLQVQQIPSEVQRYQIVPREVNNDYIQNIAGAFGIVSPTILPSPDGQHLFMVGGPDDSKQLRVDTASGGFVYQDLGELWTDPERQRELPPNAERAESIATGFLAQHMQQLPNSAPFLASNISPTIELEGVSLGAISTTTVLPTTPTSPTNYAIHYARALDLGNGEFASVVGPGSRLNVYVGHNNQVIGLKGGARSVELVVQSQTGPGTAAAQATTPIMTAEQAWAAFQADPSIALAQPPQASKYITENKSAPTVAYYEQASTLGQAELIPVWLFVADLYTQTTSSEGVEPRIPMDALVASDVQIYVPAAAAAQNATPVASIITPISGTVFMPDQQVNLNGQASGGMGPYTYVWSSSKDGPLGNGQALIIPGLSADLKGGVLQPTRVMLTVIDANGQTDSAEVEVTVMFRYYMPLINKP